MTQPPRRPQPGYIEADRLHLYRTKDFCGVPVEGGGYRIEGCHAQAKLWLRENAGHGFRAQFMDEKGYLRAEDEDEIQALITQLQSEHG